MFLQKIISFKKNYQILVKIDKNGQLEAYTFQNLKMDVYFHKTQLLYEITYPLKPIVKSIITVYANVSNPPPSP